MKTFKQFINEDAPTNNIGSGQIATPGYSKRDRRKKSDVEHMYKLIKKGGRKILTK